MDKILLYSPFIIITLYVIGIVGLMLYSNSRNTIFEAHKESSDYSWTRVAGTFLISSAIVIAFAQILGNKDPNIVLISSMLAVAIGGKVVQKRSENGGSLFTLNKNKDGDIQKDDTIIDVKENSNETKSEPKSEYADESEYTEESDEFGRESFRSCSECRREFCENCDTDRSES